MSETKHILIGVTGSVAAIKIPEIVAKFQQAEKNVNFKIEVTYLQNRKPL